MINGHPDKETFCYAFEYTGLIMSSLITTLLLIFRNQTLSKNEQLRN